MAASYPTSVKLFTSKNTGDTIQAAHVNDLQDEVVAIETELVGAWASFTPTWTDLSVGNGTVDAKFRRVGKTIHFTILLTFGSTTSVTGQIIVSLPVAARLTSSGALMANVLMLDNSTTGHYQGRAHSASGGTAMGLLNSTSPMTAINATTPFTWATSDLLFIGGTYEAA